MKKGYLLAALSAALIYTLPISVNAQTSGSEGATSESSVPVPNMFDPSTWMQNQAGAAQGAPGGGFNWSSLGNLFAMPGGQQGGVPLNLARPGGWTVFMNPATYPQLMNPATYGQMMTPQFYMQYMNPSNWMSWLDPSAYAAFINPMTYMQMLNPMAYMGMINPMSYLQWANPSNYGAFINPMTYMQWLNPSAYSFQQQPSGMMPGMMPGMPGMSQGGYGAGGFNWFDPSIWNNMMQGMQQPQTQ